MKYLKLHLGIIFGLAIHGFAPASAFSQASQPASAPSVGPVSANMLKSQVFLSFELEESYLKVQESWQIENPTNGHVPAEDIVYALGGNIRNLKLDEDVMGFATKEGSTVIRATGPIRPGSTHFAFSYRLPVSGSGRADVRRRLSIPITSGSIVAEDIEGVDVSGSLEFSHTADLNGLNFRVFRMANLNREQELVIQFTNLPFHNAVPRYIAFALSGAAFVWLIWGLTTIPISNTSQKGALSAEARREQLVRALEILEEDRSSGQIEGKKYERRRKGLMADLASVLREVHLAQTEENRANSGPS